VLVNNRHSRNPHSREISSCQRTRGGHEKASKHVSKGRWDRIGRLFKGFVNGRVSQKE
jgi:hypothetical protein